jgi:SAM-dependent methyltransferase
MVCRQCRASFVWPLKIDDEVYELIYRHAWRTPGYHEYFVFADGVLRAADPLSYIESVSRVHWAVGRYLREKSKGRPLRILEVGCGLGYFTYALSRAGFDATGVDISRVAVGKARRRYGDRFVCADLLSSGDDGLGRFDVVVCTEMIEHVEDPRAVLRAMRELLEDDGELVLTTPNKSAFPGNAVWETDLPPVHLWWFTPGSIGFLATGAGFSGVRFRDFAGCPSGWVHPDASREYSRPVGRPVFDRKGRLRFEGAGKLAFRLALRNLARRAGLLDTILRLKRGAAGRVSPVGPPDSAGHANLCAVLAK